MQINLERRNKTVLLMNSTLSKGSYIRLKFLGFYQIIGGVTGLLISIWALANTLNLTGLGLVLFAFAFALYSFSVYSGKLLLSNSYEKGLILSLVNQLLQIVTFLIMGFGFLYLSGIALFGRMGYYVGDTGSGFDIGFVFELIPKWRFDFASDDHSFELGCNFIAVYLTYFCYNLLRRVRNEQTIN